MIWSTSCDKSTYSCINFILCISFSKASSGQENLLNPKNWLSFWLKNMDKKKSYMCENHDLLP
jgi:hypothetical protein